MATARSSPRRWRVGITAIVVASALLVATRGDHPEGATSAQYSLSCLPFEPPSTVRELNDLVAGYREVPGFIGADVGADVRLSDGRRLWVFGDTLRRGESGHVDIVRNSMLLFSPGCATVVMPRDGGPVVPDRHDGVGYWPMSLGLVERTGFDLVGVGLNRVRSTGPAAWDFETLGTSLAVFDVRANAAPTLVDVVDLGPDDPDVRKPAWGAAVATAGDWIYLYGTARPDEHAFGSSLRVARVHADELIHLGRWQYWDGRRWQSDAGRAAVLIPAQHGVSQTLSVFHRDGRWFAVSKRDDLFGSDLVIWTAPGPTGPFVAGPPVAQIPSDSHGGLLRYMPLAHPDLLPRREQVLVSYSRNVADPSRILANPDLYRPHFLMVPLPPSR